MSTMKDREHAAENAYFNREEQRLLQKMVSKLKTHVDTNDKKDDSKDGRFIDNVLRPSPLVTELDIIVLTFQKCL